MILFNSYLHRASFYELIRRWMYNQPQSDDAVLVTRLVHFNNVYLSRYLKLFSSRVFQDLTRSKMITRFAPFKQDLKDVIVAQPPFLTPRVEELVGDYRRHPERYYRETPFHGTLYFGPSVNGDRYLGSSRIKRVRRLAEKSSRRIIDSIFATIKQHASSLAFDRARMMGLGPSDLITRPAEMLSEFLDAENRLLDDLRTQRPIYFPNELAINDVAGIKIIVKDEDYPRMRDLFERYSDCQVTEEEPHSGRYNAVNLIIRYTPDKNAILAEPLGNGTLSGMAKCGLDPEQVAHEFSRFVDQGEDQVHIEVIISNYQEMLESEIGRCIHEDRILEQRRRQEYRSHLAKNIEYLMVYIFNFAVSPRNELGDLPIKLWTRYLPDYFDETLRSLYDIPPLRLAE